jgi:hypothetical protein
MNGNPTRHKYFRESYLRLLIDAEFLTGSELIRACTKAYRALPSMRLFRPREEGSSQ